MTRPTSGHAHFRSRPLPATPTWGHTSTVDISPSFAPHPWPHGGDAPAGQWQHGHNATTRPTSGHAHFRPRPLPATPTWRHTSTVDKSPSFAPHPWPHGGAAPAGQWQHGHHAMTTPTSGHTHFRPHPRWPRSLRTHTPKSCHTIGQPHHGHESMATPTSDHTHFQSYPHRPRPLHIHSPTSRHAIG